jgi:hypothetical protein
LPFKQNTKKTANAREVICRKAHIGEYYARAVKLFLLSFIPINVALQSAFANDGGVFVFSDIFLFLERSFIVNSFQCASLPSNNARNVLCCIASTLF